MYVHKEQGLAGRRVAVFESRFEKEFANLVRKQGGEPVVGPTMVEAPLALGDEVRSFVAELRAGTLQGMLVLTGVGQRKLVNLVAELLPAEEFGELLRKITVAARGPKSVQALKELGLKPNVVAPEPHTWQTLLAALEAHMELKGTRWALQQYGVPHEQLTRALQARGVEVVQVPVYRWQLPEDLAPLHAVIHAICAGEVDVVLFTSGPQAGALVEVAQQLGCEDVLRRELARCVIGSVGPSCTESLGNLGLTPDLEPAHGKMGHLVVEAARRVPEILAQKRG